MSDQGAQPEPDGTYPSATQARCWAQEVISSQLQGDDDVRDRLLAEYCSSADGALLGVMIAFFEAAVHVNHPPTAFPRSFFAITMLGDLVEMVAGVLSVPCGDVAAAVAAAECEPEMEPSDQQVVQAAQVALVSHMFVRQGGQPFGIQAGLDPQSLSDLVGGVLQLTTHLCVSVRERVGDLELIRFLLPRVVWILELGATSCQMSVQDYTQMLWIELVLGDCQEG